MRSLLFATLFFSSLAGCGFESEYYVSGPPPPPPYYEVAPPAPYPGAVWIGGSYRWAGGRYVWNRGYYSRPRPGYVWAPHQYAPRGGRPSTSTAAGGVIGSRADSKPE